MAVRNIATHQTDTLAGQAFVLGPYRRAGAQQIRASARVSYSHSMVPGGLDVTSSTTRFTSRTSLVIRVEIFSSTS